MAQGPLNPRADLVVLRGGDSAAGARVATVHFVGTSSLGAGHGPGVLVHRRGHILSIDNLSDYLADRQP